MRKFMYRAATRGSLTGQWHLAAYLGIFLLGTCLLGAGCDEDTTDGPRMTSESHWLVECVQDTDCQSGYECLCGICTQGCVDTSGCQNSEGTSLTCAPTNQAPGASLCQVANDSMTSGLCLPACTVDADCPAQNHTCDAGFCVPRGNTDPDPMDMSDTADQDMSAEITPDVADMETMTEEGLCTETGGRWDPTACGHFVCGQGADCDAIVPGCDCGATRNFVAGQGCMLDETCADTLRERTCVESGGQWDPGTCGDYICGSPSPVQCAEPIPGCNCGSDRNYVAEQGCRVDTACAGPDQQGLCEDTGGTWSDDECGDASCGVWPDQTCLVPIPGCNCGASENFVRDRGCVPDTTCAPSDQARCEMTSGRWDTNTCGHFQCGMPNACLAVIPGCDCGPDANFVQAQGCMPDPICAATQPQVLCENSGGTWDVNACGNYTCGQQLMVCVTPEPGCDCGSGSNYVDGVGCMPDMICAAITLCDQTNGTWDPGACAYACGNPAPCLPPPFVPPGACQCNPAQTFQSGQGCIADATCMPTNQQLCTATGGAWDTSAACPFVCGMQPPCAPPGPVADPCNCGPTANFVSGVGCQADAMCNP